MIIENRSHTYVAVQKLDSGEIEQYLCRRMEKGASVGCRLAAIPNVYMTKLLPYLKAQAENGNFADFSEVFSDEQFTYAVTAASSFPSLEEKLSGERCSLRERLEITKNLLTALLLSGCDDFFSCAALSVGRVCVGSSLEIGFQYDLRDVLNHEDYGFSHTADRLAAVLGYLFQEEIKRQSFPELEELLMKLRRGDFSGLMDAYGWFLPVYEAWLTKNEKDLQPKSFWFRLWERVKAMARGLFWLWKLFLILIATAYLALSIAGLVREPEVKENFDKIGSLTIP